MPNTQSATKAMRQSARRRTRNLKSKDKYKDALKKFRKLVKDSKLEEAKKAMTQAASLIDKAFKKHLVHGNKSARLKSRMAKAIKKLSA